MTKIVTFNELRAYGVLYSRTHVDRLEKAGNFPKRVALGTFRMGWLESEIINYVRTQIATRSREPGALGSDGKIKKKGRTKKTRAPETEEETRPIIPVPSGSHEP
jgi:prophage regulatory protein